MANRVGVLSTFANVAPPWSLPNLDANFTAIRGALQDSSLGYMNYAGTDTGSPNNYIVTCPFGAPGAFNPGMALAFQPANTNTGASNILVNPLTSVPITRADGSALSGGELIAGVMATLVFDTTSFRIIGPTVPPGTIVMSGSPSVPPAYLNCTGAAVSRTIFAPLFAAIGTIHGAGDGSTTFNVPNLGGRMPIAPGGPGALGSIGGSNLIATSQLPAHTHTLTATLTHSHSITEPPGGHAHNLIQHVQGVTAGADFNALKVDTGAAFLNTAAAVTGINTTNPQALSGTTDNTGGGIAYYPYYTVVNFFIKT